MSQYSQLLEQSCAKVLDASINALWTSTERYIQAVGDVGPDDQVMGKMLGVMSSYCMMDMRRQASAESIAEARQLEPSEKTFGEVYNTIMAEKEKTLPFARMHPKYKLYVKKVALLTTKEVAQVETNGDEDAELVVTQAEINMIDPISRQLMVSPVKNTKCGHSYDRHSIMALFGKKRKLRCPYVGCTNSGHFIIDDLEEDFELKQLIRQHQTQTNLK